jgi:thioredoxin reductase/ferredoxin
MADILKLSFEFSPKIGVREAPRIDDRYQSDVKGLYVVGDLADAPIIKVALNQGYDVAKRVWEEDLGGTTGTDVLDFVVIGAGPAGIGAALALNEVGANYTVLEKERPFATIQNFPRSKLIFSEPKHIANKGNFWFEDARTDELVERWDQALDDHSLPIQQPVEVTDVQRVNGVMEVSTKGGETFRARAVLLAIGRRGTVRKLDIPGERLDKVRYNLKDPEDHRGRKVLVVGGGDSAVEVACDCADSGAEVTIVYRKDSFSRPKLKNQERIATYIQSGRVMALMSASPVEVLLDSVAVERAGERIDVPNDDVLVLIGTTLPHGFLRRLGIKMQGDWDWTRRIWVTAFAAFTYLFYVLKGGTEFSEAHGMQVAKKAFWPLGPDHIAGMVPDLLHVDLGFRAIDGAFWGTAMYSLLILVFGIRAYRKYPQATQKKRYLSLITFQALFLFGIPELVAPAVIHTFGEGGWAWNLFGGDRAWKFYGLSVPWPLNIWALIDAPSWTATGNKGTVVGWLLASASVSFIAVPLFVRYHGERFCSWMCGCGGLAETLGDFWRHLAPRGTTSYKAENAGRVILFAAIPVTLLILNDAWGFFAQGALYSTKAFAEHWYVLMVDFMLASVVGVALYPTLGNRVWCRFFCPLRAYMELLSKWFSTITIKSNDKCIGCGECTRYCQMGIDVQRYAQRQTDLDNSDSACIQCGVCIQVCPMEVLSIGTKGQEVSLAV